jgi:hypothetical protein
VPFVGFPLERLYQPTKGVLLERGNVVEDAIPPVRRYRF